MSPIKNKQDIESKAKKPSLALVEASTPAAEANEAQVTGAAISVSAETKSHYDALSNAKVMIVSDDALNAEMMRTFLEEFGYTNIILSSEIPEAFDLIFNERPDVVLFENSAFTKADFEILEKVRNNRTTRRVPILILTAYAEQSAKLKALELGVMDVLIKPASSNELALRLRNILSVKTYHDHIANFDKLTNLENRETFINHIELALKYSKRYNTTGAVLQIGMNRFKNVNDAYGPATGDQLLKEIAVRIKNLLRQSDMIARAGEDHEGIITSRFSGDEFSTLLPIISHVDDAAIVTRRIQEEINQPFLIKEKEIHLTCNVGISVFPNDGANADAILHGAGVSLGQTKKQLTANYLFYSKELNDQSLHRLTMEHDLHLAIEKKQFELYYQPQISIKTKKIAGVEALIRWKHPERGYISPVEFIPLAEESGIIIPIGNWVINQACKDISLWQSLNLNAPRVSINISRHQFTSNLIIEEINQALNKHGIKADKLTLEVTESVVMNDIDQTVATFNALKAMGAKISMDDFGTGYSSFMHLKQLPIDELKIDRTFIMDIGKAKNTEAIILAIIAMGHTLDFSVVSEGVETVEQLNFLDQHNCDYYQGYLYSKAIDAKSFGALLA
ncbi:MAG: putative bifunctional diguanylate cyclase/phosphodiesterase [Methylophilaceae bacterium]